VNTSAILFRHSWLPIVFFIKPHVHIPLIKMEWQSARITLFFFMVVFLNNFGVMFNVCYLINQIPSCVLINQIPHSIFVLSSISPPFNSLCFWVHLFVHNPNSDPLSARSHKYVLLDYPWYHKGYKCFSPLFVVI